MKAIFFDLYGTLIDIKTEEDNLIFWEIVARKWKSYHNYAPIELKNRYLSICLKQEQAKEEIDVLDAFSELFQVDKPLARRFAKDFRKCSTKYLRLYSGVKSFLKQLRKKGYAMYILSNAQASFTMPELKKLKILKYFNGVAISSDFGVKKPNENFFLKAIEKFNLSISTLVMIGNDYECDIIPAKNLRIKTIFIQSNLTPKHDVKNYVLGFNKKEIINEIEKFGL